MTECFSCAHNALEDPPAREDVVPGGAWRVAHSFDSRCWVALQSRGATSPRSTHSRPTSSCPR